MVSTLKRVSVLCVVVAAVTPSASFAQIKVFCSGGFRAAYSEVLPEFERRTGITVTTTWAPSEGNYANTIGRRLARGEVADVVIMTRERLTELIAEERIAKGSEVDLAQTPLGVAVKAGAPPPDISSVEQFKRALLSARSVATAGSLVENKLFPMLGLPEQFAMKLTRVGATAVVTGYADIAVQPVSELLAVTGLTYVGPIPSEVQYLVVFSAAIVRGSNEVAAAKLLIDYLASEQTVAAARKNGMERVGAK